MIFILFGLFGRGWVRCVYCWFLMGLFWVEVSGVRLVVVSVRVVF